MPRSALPKRRLADGLTLVEVVFALVFGLIMILGTLGFSYYSRLDAHKANVQSNAARLAAMLLERWKAAAGDAAYAPEEAFATEFEISALDELDADETLTNPLGTYRIITNDVTYYATLSYDDAVSGGPKILNVTVAWTEDRQDYNDSSMRKSVRLTGYVQDY